jgi:hypothetical protein
MHALVIRQLGNHNIRYTSLTGPISGSLVQLAALSLGSASSSYAPGVALNPYRSYGPIEGRGRRTRRCDY